MKPLECIDYMRESVGQGLEQVGGAMQWLGRKIRPQRMHPLKKALIITCLAAAALALIGLQAVAVIATRLDLIYAGALPVSMTLVALGLTVLISNVMLVELVKSAMRTVRA